MDQQSTADLIKSEAGGKIADLINRLAGPLVEEFGLILGDSFRVYRVRNWVRTVKKTERILREANLPPKAVPPRTFLPLTEACSVEDDESLQEMWAGLLATASQEADSVPPSFVETLKQLTPAEAKYLDRLYDSQKELHPEYWDQGQRPVNPYLFSSKGGAPDGVSSDAFERLGLIRRELSVQLVGNSNLMDFVGSLQAAATAMEAMQTEVEYEFQFTDFAVRFLGACRGPKGNSRPDVATGDRKA